MSPLTTHVLDATAGRPAAGVHVALTTAAGDPVADAVTDTDGRIAALGPETLSPGTYTITFATGDYFAAQGQQTFYPEVSITFTVADQAHYHVPLLLSPFAYSTYRGS